MGESIWQSMERKGYSRREFMRFCAAAAAAAGLGKTGVAQVAQAFEKKEKPVVVWMHFQECTGCSESFLRSSHPIVADALLDVLSLNYQETLMAPSGFQAEKSLNDTIRDHKGKYILVAEGAVPTKDGGVYCMLQGKTAESVLKTVAADAAAVVAWGTCASYGGVQAAKPNPTGAVPISKIVNQPVVNVPGCPAIADVMMSVVTHLLVLGQIPALDSLGRPKEFYGRRVHDTCYRRPNYDAGLFVESWDDENARKGYCLYKMGCRGPVTYNACSVVKWNEGTSYPIQSGHGCIGCSEAGFWDNGPFYQHLASFPGFGIESTADTVGTVVGLTTIAGVAAHAVATNIRKKQVIAEVHAEEKKEQQ
ncbi:MAG TPA: hydrogenase small subunit [Terracidiphilus sp.]|nr:hydrogenase small subunit [Terracidiphilus sp.]